MWWDKTLKDILRRLDKMEHRQELHARDSDVRLDNIEKVLIVQEQNLKEHMRRSDHLEDVVETMREKEITPMRKHINMVEGAFKFLGILGVIVSVIGGILKIVGII